RLEAGKTVQADLDVSAWLPATLDGIVSWKGKPPEAARVLLQGSSGDQRWQVGELVPDPTGRFRARNVPPGTYRLTLVRGGERTIFPGEVELEPGKPVAHEFRFD